MIVRFFALVGMIAIGLAPGAKADDLRAAASKVSDCRLIEDDAARLVCLDAAALALSLALDAGAVAAPATPEPAPAPVAEAPKEPKWAQAPEPKNKPVKKAAVAPDNEIETDAEKSVPFWARVFTPGDDDEEAVYKVTITRITRNNLGRHFFYTSEGQVWRQTVVEPVKPPKSLPAEAKIAQEMMGAPSLRFEAGPKGDYRVRRIE